MKTYILVGERAVRSLQNEEWKDLEAAILEDCAGDLVAWNKKDTISELLEMLRGLDDFIELSKDCICQIENNTKIEID